MRKKILFIGHYAGYTGAPIILLRLMKWLKENSDIDFEIILKCDGVLRAEYEKLSPVIIYHAPQKEKDILTQNFINRIKTYFSDKRQQPEYLKQKYPIGSVDLIFSNTITNGEILSSLSHLQCPVICRVAELDYWINRSGKVNFEQVKKYSSHFIAVSNAVKENLIRNHKIPGEKIDVIHGFIDPTNNIEKNTLRKKMNIPEDGIIVGGSGAEIWRKGKDLFIQLAINVFNRCKNLPIYFVWLGGENDSEDSYRILHDLKKANLTDKVFFLPEVSNPLDYYTDFDMFAMVSREDPYPVVNIEVASLGKPILCFNNAGGSPELVEEDSGFVVPYLDVEAMAEKVIQLCKNKNLRKQLGDQAANKVRDRHSILTTAPKILKIINNFLA